MDIFKCKFFNGKTTNNIENRVIYKCMIIEAYITTKKRQLFERFFGFNLQGKTRDDVECVCFLENNLDYFLRGLHKHFINLKCLEISDCTLREITKNDLKGLEGLVSLKIELCELTSLPDDLFSKMPNLKDVSFFRNNIEAASSKLLVPLVGRENISVDLRRNKNIDECFLSGKAKRKANSLASLDELMKLIDEKCIKPTLLIENSNFHPFFFPKMKELLASGIFSDLTISVEDKKFKVHKAILLPQSEVFAQIFEDQSDVTEIPISDFSLKSVEALINFMYTNEITADENVMKNFEILEIAEKFKVDAMKTSYEELICDELDDSNAVEIFYLAHHFNSQVIKKEAFDHVANKHKSVPMEFIEHPEKLKEFLVIQPFVGKALRFTGRYSSDLLKGVPFEEISKIFQEELPEVVLKNPERLQTVMDAFHGIIKTFRKVNKLDL